jgi:hypothetical protein
VPREAPFRRTLKRLAHFGDQALDLMADARKRIAHEEGTLNWLDRPDERFDELWQRARNRVPVIGRRDRTALDWRFCAKPGPRIAFATWERRDQLEAYAALELEGEVAHIRDLFAADELQLRALLHALVDALNAQNRRSVSIRFLGAPWLVDMLKRQGFHEREDRWIIFVAPSQHPPTEHESLVERSSWYLTDFDEDM